MRITFIATLLLLPLLGGCSKQTNIGFNKETEINFNDPNETGINHVATVKCDSISGGIEILFVNKGDEEFTFERFNTYYEDASGKSLGTIQGFVTQKYGRMMLFDRISVAAGQRNFAGFTPPAEASYIVFKDAGHDNILFRIALK